MTEPGKKFSFKELISYKEGGIVSTRIRNNSSVSMTLFSFDKDQELTKHSSPFEALVQVLEGEVKITIDNSEFDLKKEDLIFLPATIPHVVYASTAFSMVLTIIKSE